jgi:hypothetical protein
MKVELEDYVLLAEVTVEFVEVVLVTVELAGFVWGLFEVLTVVFTGLNSSQLPLGGAIGPGPNIGRDIITGVVAVSILEIV